METSILKYVRSGVGLDSEFDGFDSELIIFINSALSHVNQLGVGPDIPVVVEDDTLEWSSVIEATVGIENLKTYVVLKVKQGFDPPQTSFQLAALNELIELEEFRLMSTIELQTEEVL